ncbi:MAG: replication-associated recombination protein A [Actinomycetota bacterium]|nr:replication-associated recombination protein A [Actinomycetota bacterium]
MDRLFDAPESPPRPGGPAGPLAARMRPATLDEVVGQEHLLGTAAHPSALRRAIDEGRPHSMVLYGPPGSGKTTLARLVATTADAAFEELSAVEAGRAEVRSIIAAARERRQTGRATILFLDEIHRFNKAQQDALLPAVEEGLVTLIGATTENPYFEVNGALLSRAQVYELAELNADDVEVLLRRALERGECGDTAVQDEAMAFLATRAGGDARVALSALELACEEGRPVDLALAEEALQRRALRYDQGGDQHYDLISAWIKATRASDPDASLYYLAVMLEGGEDPRFIARRMIILASEDVGNADPQALVVTVAAAHAVEHVGLPEGQHALAQAAVYLSLAPKSNAAYRAIAAARRHVREHGAAPPPAPLRSAYPGAAALAGASHGEAVGLGSRGLGYEYPHDHPGHVAPQPVMPEGLEGVRFYEPDEQEAALRDRAAQLRRLRGD